MDGKKERAVRWDVFIPCFLVIGGAAILGVVNNAWLTQANRFCYLSCRSCTKSAWHEFIFPSFQALPTFFLEEFFAARFSGANISIYLIAYPRFPFPGTSSYDTGNFAA